MGASRDRSHLLGSIPGAEGARALAAALHAALLGGDDELRLPFSWSDVRVHAAGVTQLRVRLRQDDDNSISLAAFDEYGSPVLSVGSMSGRPLVSDQLREIQLNSS